MTVQELIKVLEKLDQNSTVRFWNYAELREENIKEEDIIVQNHVVLIE